MTQPILVNLPAMTEQQRADFYYRYQNEQKSEVAGVLLALFLGWVGAHQFYLRRPGLGILYIFLPGVSMILGWIEAFFMPGRVRRFNAELSAYLAAAVTGQAILPGTATLPGTSTLPAPAIYCAACGAASTSGVHFCGRCGAAIAS